MVLRDYLRSTKMIGSNMATSYLIEIQQVQYELVVVGEIVVDSKLVRMTLKGFKKEWTYFIKGTMAREMLLDWSCFWDEFIHE